MSLTNAALLKIANESFVNAENAGQNLLLEDAMRARSAAASLLILARNSRVRSK